MDTPHLARVVPHLPAETLQQLIRWRGLESSGEMVFKLPDPAAHEKALGLDGAKLFDPGKNGRPFKEWVQVPFAHADEWTGLADTAIRLRAG